MSSAELFALDQEGVDELQEMVQRGALLPPRRAGQRVSAHRPVRDTPSQWVKATSGSTSTVNLSGGGTAQCYPALWSQYNSDAGTWADNQAVWLLTANGETAASGTRYLCRLAGADVTGQAIWGAEIQGGGGYTGTFSLVSTVTCSGSTLTVKFRDITYANGDLQSVSAEHL